MRISVSPYSPPPPLGDFHADIIANMSPLPDFKSATNMLCVKELRLDTEHKEASASALAVSTAPSYMSPAIPPPPPAMGAVARAKGAVAAGTVVLGATSSTAAADATSNRVAAANHPSRLVLGFATTPRLVPGLLSSSSGRLLSISSGRLLCLLHSRLTPLCAAAVSRRRCFFMRLEYDQVDCCS